MLSFLPNTLIYSLIGTDCPTMNQTQYINKANSAHTQGSIPEMTAGHANSMLVLSSLPTTYIRIFSCDSQDPLQRANHNHSGDTTNTLGLFNFVMD